MSAQEHGICETEITGNLREGLVAQLDLLHRFPFEFPREGALHLGHGLVPFSGSSLLPVYLLHFSGSRPTSTNYVDIVMVSNTLRHCLAGFVRMTMSSPKSEMLRPPIYFSISIVAIKSEPSCSSEPLPISTQQQSSRVRDSDQFLLLKAVMRGRVYHRVLVSVQGANWERSVIPLPSDASLSL